MAMVEFEDLIQCQRGSGASLPRQILPEAGTFVALLQVRPA